MLSVDDARARILSQTPVLPEESRFLGDAAGRILAVDAVAQRFLPPHDNSAMDGYGVRAEDVAQAQTDAPVTLKVVGRSLPGSPFDPAVSLGKGEAIRIMTGAKIHLGVDAVVMRENTNEDQVVENDATASGTVGVRVAVALGEAIRRRGEDVH